LGVVIGLIFLRLGYSQKNAQDRIGVLFFITAMTTMGGLFSSITVFLTAERPVFNRERGAKAYRVTSYYIAKAIADLPGSIIFPLIMAVISYWMVNLNPSAGRFFIFLLITALTSICASSIGMLIGSIAPTIDVATALTPVVMTLAMLFGGFYIQVSNLPKWLVWAYWTSIFHFSYEAYILNEFAGEEFDCPPAPQTCMMRTGDELIDNLGMNNPLSNVWIDIAFLVTITLVCRLLAYFVLRFLRKPKGG